MTRRVHPILALAGAVVVIDTLCEASITQVLRRNRGEALVGVAWLAIHVAKETPSSPRLDRSIQQHEPNNLQSLYSHLGRFLRSGPGANGSSSAQRTQPS